MVASGFVVCPHLELRRQQRRIPRRHGCNINFFKEQQLNAKMRWECKRVGLVFVWMDSAECRIDQDYAALCIVGCDITLVDVDGMHKWRSG